MAPDLEDRRALGRELASGVLRGVSLEDLAWASGRDSDEVLRLVRETVAPAKADAGTDPGPDDRQRIVSYLLLRQSPGQAAGTWEILRDSEAALEWAQAARERLGDLYPGAAPPLPGDDGTTSFPGLERDESARPPGRGPVGRKRAERRELRNKAEIQAAVAVEVSPYREEAVRRHGEHDTEIRLPHYASRQVRIALYGLVTALTAVLIMCALVSVPVYSTAKVLVVDLPEAAPGDLGGPTMIALFPSDALDRVRAGEQLRVKLPDTEERVSSRIAYVEDQVRGPQEVARRYALPELQAKRVREPYVVAVAPLKTPEGAPPRDSFEGVVTTEAEARTGSRRIIGLLF